MELPWDSTAASPISTSSGRRDISSGIRGSFSIPENAVRTVRAVLKHTEEAELPELAKTLKSQKKKKNFHGLYDHVVIYLTCSSCRMASNRLSREPLANFAGSSSPT